MYRCPSCGHDTKKFFNNVDSVTESTTCKNCGEKAERQLSSPSSKSTMIVDNGLQARETEIIHDIVNLNKERDEKGYNRGD
jgi:putative FmdB family regulatory protein